jgi:hypothetical protein
MDTVFAQLRLLYACHSLNCDFKVAQKLAIKERESCKIYLHKHKR